MLCGLAAAGSMVVAACGSDASEPSSTAYDRVVGAARPGQWRSIGADTVEVWVCHVHPAATAPLYGGLALRVPMAPATLAALFQQRVSRYFHTISHGLYEPTFVPGGEVTMGIDDDQQDCIDDAIAGAADTTRVVLAVADAEHAADQPGGMGSGGDVVPVTSAPVSVTRRYAYVGAADFDRGTWGDDPPFDLVEHELGHTLGLVHSGLSLNGDYLSALDLMSNSAAPRDTQPARRDGPDLIAIHRAVAGWLPASGVTLADGAVSATLTPSTGDSGIRLLVLPVDNGAFLTVELLTVAGYDDHLPVAGIAVHRVSVDGDAITAIDPLTGNAPFTELVQPGAELVTDGWTVTVGADGKVDASPAS
jgi:hypothetical protein